MYGKMLSLSALLTDLRVIADPHDIAEADEVLFPISVRVLWLVILGEFVGFLAVGPYLFDCS